MMWRSAGTFGIQGKTITPFHSARFQQRALRDACHVPENLECPRCRHAFEIVVSRRQIRQGPLKRRLIRRFHCQVCGCRFSRLNTRPIPGLVLAFLVTVAAFWLPVWLV